MGLLIMGYRAKMIGGVLEVGPAPDGGTSVCCTFPAGNLE
jgi:signal transduction histidine kinase